VPFEGNLNFSTTQIQKKYQYSLQIVMGKNVATKKKERKNLVQQFKYS
jgi:hypothetical protein